MIYIYIRHYYYKNIITFFLGKKLNLGNAVVKYSFTGCLNDKMKGFYRSKYTVDGEERYARVPLSIGKAMSPFIYFLYYVLEKFSLCS